jgi:hypothetical protein
MKRILVIISGLLFSTMLFAQKQINDPNAQVREAKDFHAISVSSSFDVYLTQDNSEAVAVSASEPKYVAEITVEVRNGVLHIGWQHKGRWNNGNKKLKAYISFKNIDKLTASGACNVNIVGSIKAQELKVNLSGASDVKGQIETSRLSFDLSGASDARISGTASTLDIEASGASSFKGYELSTDKCDAKASGASDIKVTVNKELSANASGASDIHYKGNGVIVDIKTSGASSISRS